MTTTDLLLNNKKISYDEIKSSVVVGDSPFEQSTLGFCRQWLNGQGLFSLKTSGSTGEPKPIRVSRYQMSLSANQTIDFFDLSSVDTVLVSLNTAYIAGIMMLVRAFEADAQIIAVEPSGNPLLGVNQQIDFIAVVPLQLEQILDNPITKTQLEKCRAAIVGGAHVTISLEEKIKGSTANIYATFGMTETLTHFALKKLNPNKEDYFSAFEGVTITRNSEGCLTVASDVTEQKTLVTNDLVEILSPNSFKWLGRVDNVINSGGIKLQVELLERKVEHAFHDLGLINRFFIGAQPDDTLGEKVTLIVESKNDLKILGNLDWSKYMDKYEKPKDILYSSQFQETATNKINRSKTLKLI